MRLGKKSLQYSSAEIQNIRTSETQKIRNLEIYLIKYEKILFGEFIIFRSK